MKTPTRHTLGSCIQAHALASECRGTIAGLHFKGIVYRCQRCIIHTLSWCRMHTRTCTRRRVHACAYRPIRQQGHTYTRARVHSRSRAHIALKIAGSRAWWQQLQERGQEGESEPETSSGSCATSAATATWICTVQKRSFLPPPAPAAKTGIRPRLRSFCA